MPFAALKLQVDWNNDGDFLDANEDVTAYVMEEIPVTWELGRDYASQLLGKSVAGKLSLSLWNEDGRFSRFNAASPLFGNIKPGRTVRLTMTYSAVDYVQWEGQLEDLEPDSPRPNLQLAKLTALGPLAALQKPLAIAAQTSILTGAADGVVLDAADWPAAKRSIDTGQTTMTRWWGEVQADYMLRAIEEAEAGFLRETKDGEVAFEDRHHRLTSPHTVSQATYSDNPAEALHPSVAQHGDPLRELLNIISAEVRLYTVGTLATLWEHPEDDAAGTRPSIPPGESLTVWASYPNEASPTDAMAVDAWTTPVATTDYVFDSQADGAGTDLTASISVAVSKFAKSMKITYTNNHATLPAYLILSQARGTPLTSKSVVVKAEDAASQADYGVREYRLPATFIPTTLEATDRVRAELSIRKDPLAVLSLTLDANVSAAALVEALTRDVSDRVTVDLDGAAGLYIAEDYFVEAMRHSYRQGRHVVTLDLSPATAYGGFIVLDVGPPLGTGRLGY